MCVKDAYCVTGEATDIINLATETCDNRNCKEIKLKWSIKKKKNCNEIYKSNSQMLLTVFTKPSPSLASAVHRCQSAALYALHKIH